jgi:hypothetical protein
LETWRLPFHRHIDNALFISGRFNCVRITRLVQFQRHAVSVEACLWLIEAVILERVGAELMLSRSFMVEDLAVELGGGMETTINK